MTRFLRRLFATPPSRAVARADWHDGWIADALLDSARDLAKRDRARAYAALPASEREHLRSHTLRLVEMAQRLHLARMP